MTENCYKIYTTKGKTVAVLYANGQTDTLFVTSTMEDAGVEPNDHFLRLQLVYYVEFYRQEVFDYVPCLTRVRI